ncbi:helix-turn-helix domain-containing protein [Fusobacterium varium]
MRTTGEILRKKREYLGITAEKLGEMTEVSQAYVTMTEKNTTKPSKAYLRKVKDILHLSEIEEKEIAEFEEFRRLPKKVQERLLLLDKQVIDPRIIGLNKRELNQYEATLNQASSFFGDEKVSEEDKKKMLDVITELFFDAKLKNKEKYSKGKITKK